MSSVDSELLERNLGISPTPPPLAAAAAPAAPLAAAAVATGGSGGSGSPEEECDGFISQINQDGEIEQVPVKYEGENVVTVVKSPSVPDGGIVIGGSGGGGGGGGDVPADPSVAAAADDEEEEEDGPGTMMADFMSADILTKPFNFVSGNATKSRFNPFRKKKSGLLNVLAKQATRNRLMAKNGQVRYSLTQQKSLKLK